MAQRHEAAQRRVGPRSKVVPGARIQLARRRAASRPSPVTVHIHGCARTRRGNRPGRARRLADEERPDLELRVRAGREEHLGAGGHGTARERHGEEQPRGHRADARVGSARPVRPAPRRVRGRPASSAERRPHLSGRARRSSRGSPGRWSATRRAPRGSRRARRTREASRRPAARCRGSRGGRAGSPCPTPADGSRRARRGSGARAPASPSRPASVQKRRTASAPWRNASGVAAVECQPSPKRATRRYAPSLAPPIQIGGRGRWSGIGEATRPVEPVAPRLDLGLALRPHLPEELERLVGAAAALGEGHAERRELALHPADPRPEDQAAAREHVDAGEELGHRQRRPVGQDDHAASRARSARSRRRATASTARGSSISSR